MSALGKFEQEERDAQDRSQRLDGAEFAGRLSRALRPPSSG
jgi:hypothetical protein